MNKQKIEQIISNQIEVDCYTEDEINLGWAIYMEENMYFPFEAEYEVRKVNKQQYWQKVQVINQYTNESNFGGKQYLVEIVLDDLIIIADLDSLINIKADKETLNTIQIWNYKKY